MRREKKRTSCFWVATIGMLCFFTGIVSVAKADELAGKSMLPSPGAVIPPVVEAVWVSDTISSQKKLKKVQFELKNRVKETVFVEVQAMFMGLGDQESADNLGSFTLKPLESKLVTIDIRDLGIQSESSSSQAIIHMNIQRDSGKTLIKFSRPLFYHFEDGYQSVVAYDEIQLLKKYNGGQIDSDLSRANGFRRDKNGRFVFVDKSPSAMLKQASLAKPDSSGEIRGAIISTSIEEISEKTTSILPSNNIVTSADIEPANIPGANPSANANVKICGRWKTLFEDSGYGEDVWTAKTPAFRNAAYTSFTLAKSNGDNVTSGVLDSAGCSITLSLEPGTYRFSMHSDTQRTISGQLYKYAARYVYYNNGKEELAHFGQYIDFSVASGQTGNIVLSGANQYDFSNLNAIAGRILSFSPSIIVPQTYNLWYGLKCPAYQELTPCFYHHHEKRPVYLPSVSVTQKFVVGHELGHQAQYHAAGRIYTSYEHSVPSSLALCRCDQVETYSQKHCLQSREYTSTSLGEGFASFWSSGVWNYKDHNDCILAYCKQVKLPNGSIEQPPFAADCKNPMLWKLIHCPDSSETSIEWDWMIFLWNINRHLVSMQDTYNLMYRACGNRKCNDDNITWTKFNNAAIAKWGETSITYMQFYNFAILSGVTY